MKLLVLISFGLVVAVNSQISDWNYENRTSWPVKYSACNYIEQSPINLTKLTSFHAVGPELSQFQRQNFDQIPTSMIVSNNGRYVTWTPTYPADKAPRACKGSLISNLCYILESFEIHWGANDSIGSDHAVEGMKYAAEVQLMFRLATFANLTTAKNYYRGGFAIAVFLEVDPARKSTSVLLNSTILSKITNPGANYVYSTSELFPLNAFIPCNFNLFWTYWGSMTRPPCAYTFTWMVLNETVKVSSDSLKSLRVLKNTELTPMITSWRPLQPRGQRPVIRTFA